MKQRTTKYLSAGVIVAVAALAARVGRDAERRAALWS